MTGPVVDTVAAALAVGVRPPTVRKWAERGRIARVGTDARGRALYRLHDVQVAAGQAAPRPTTKEDNT